MEGSGPRLAGSRYSFWSFCPEAAVSRRNITPTLAERADLHRDYIVDIGRAARNLNLNSGATKAKINTNDKHTFSWSGRPRAKTPRTCSLGIVPEPIVVLRNVIGC